MDLKNFIFIYLTIRPIVESGESRYSKFVESFWINKIGGFARVFVVNLLHYKLLRQVLTISYTCNCFDLALLKNQWDTIDALWLKDSALAFKLIIWHVNAM